MLSIILALTPISLAVPTQLVQNGRLLDSSGAAVTGTHAITFRLYDVDVGGQLLWEDFVVTNFNSGYYTAILGANTFTPLDDSILANPSVFLEVQLDADPPLSPRQQIRSAPYARIAGKAESIEGGAVDATSISVNGSLVVDQSGSWVGPTMSVGWSAIQNIPSDIADGDDDTLAGINCSTGEILGWNGSQWACAADNGLTESEVEAYITNGPLDLDGATTSGGLPLLTEGSGGTLSGLSCQDGELPKYDMVLNSWVCGLDNDDVLSETDVETYVTNGALDWAPGTTLGGQMVMTSPNCAHGEFVSYDANQGIWVCQSVMGIFDTDGDGVLLWEDCDDGDPLVLGQSLDADCDGTFTADDCDDNNPTSTILASDADCDGAETADDCDDNDASLGAQALDMDCDGAFTADDCNDFDSSLGAIANDADCDGSLSGDDCDDNNASSNTVSIDADCDSILTADDCDDSNPLSTAIADDADCDGTVTALDCDDNDASSNTLNNDFDCDGSLTGDDCNDSNDQIWPGQTEICGNGIDEDCNGVDDTCFSAVTFTTCGHTGSNGPSQNDCNASYSNTALDGAVTLNGGIQYWTVPVTADYRITAYGAAGGAASNYGNSYPGRGAIMSGDFSLTAGDVLRILVGHKGEDGQNIGGGGGGTFVVENDGVTPLIVAGGGGGACEDYNHWSGGTYGGDGTDASTSESGQMGAFESSNYPPGAGGNNGDGGSHTTAAGGCGTGGGGGMFSNGASGPSGSSGGHGFTNGGQGSANSTTDAGVGGFGGGSGGNNQCLTSSGAGGGYSGGGGGGHDAGSGGGGSYNSGSNQTNTDSSTGSNDLAGKVEITLAN